MALSTTVNQLGLICGFASAVIFWRAKPVGVVDKDGKASRADGLDYYADPEATTNLIENSHARSRYLNPLGWKLLALSFLLQFISGWL